ncbi:PIN-like domain-containing protein [Kitasatospora sp. NPDC101235]|uniref:PIN-like domain-containing protein n=1 Tax=Kitasatospora sp. NPDC101235 TaxID=3364101 RepID=UPI003815C8B9
MSDSEDRARESKSLHDWFPAFHPKSTEELTILIQGGLVALDANVLLDLYRYIPQARNELISALRELGDRLWVPYQAGKEFHERRFNAISNQQKSFDDALSSLVQAKSQALKSLEQLQAACSIPEAELADCVRSLKRAFGGAEGKVKGQRNRLDVDQKSAISGDHILREIDDLLDGKVGPPLEADSEVRVREGAEARFSQKIPPGFEDSGKLGDRSLGDLLLWEQLIAEAKRRKIPVLLVSREQKPDWVRRRNEDVLGPHPLLVDEMNLRAGISFHLMHPGDFLRVAKTALKVAVSPSTVEVVKRGRGIEVEHVAQNRLFRQGSILGGERVEMALVEREHHMQNRMHQLKMRQAAFLGDASTLRAQLAELGSDSAEFNHGTARETIADLQVIETNLAQVEREIRSLDAEWKSIAALIADLNESRAARLSRNRQMDFPPGDSDG